MTNPCILQVVWNPDTQQVALKFESSEFRTWEFVQAILHQASLVADENRKLALMAEAQKQAMIAGLNLGGNGPARRM